MSDDTSTINSFSSTSGGGLIEKPAPCSDLSSSSNDRESCNNTEELTQFEKIKQSPIREFLFILIICSSQFITLVGATQGIPQMGAIAKTFNVQPSHLLELGWCNAAFATTVGSFVIIAGKLGDVLGHKLIFCIGYGWLALWSLLTGFSRYSKANPVFYYFCRGAQGIGAGLLTPTSVAILGKTYPECKRKNYIFAFFGACAPWGIVCGLTFSALFTQLSHWSWTYWTMGIISTLITALAIVVIPEDIISECNKSYTYRDFDYLGGFCGITGLILFSIVWNQAPKATFHNPYIYILLIVSVLLMAAALYIDTRVKDPLIPWTDICHETFRILVCVFLAYLSFTIWLFYGFRYSVIAREDTPLMGAARASPMAVAAVIATVGGALAMNAGIKPQVRMLFALICVCVATILIGTVTSGQIFWGETFVSIIFIAFALDIIFPSATLLFSDGVPDELKGISAGLVATVLNYSTALGPGIATTIIRYRCDECLARVGPTFTRTVHIALYFAIGCSGVGVLVATYGAIYELFFRKDKKYVPKHKEVESA